MCTKADKIALLYEAFLVASLVTRDANLTDTNAAFIEAVRAVEKGLTLEAFTAPDGTSAEKLAALKASDVKLLTSSTWATLFITACDNYRLWKSSLSNLEALRQCQFPSEGIEDLVVSTYSGLLANPYISTKVNLVQVVHLTPDEKWFEALYETLETISAAYKCDVKEKVLCAMGVLINKLEETCEQWFCLHQIRILLPLNLCPFHEDLLKFDQLCDIYRCYNKLKRKAFIMAVDWYVRCPKSKLLDLVRIAKLMITMKVLELNPETEEGFSELLDAGAATVKHAGRYLTFLFNANYCRWDQYSQEQITHDFWASRELYQDLDGLTLKPLSVPYLPNSEFYEDAINAHPHLLEADFVSGHAHGDYPLELVHHSCLLDLSLKSDLLHLDAKHQQQRMVFQLSHHRPFFFLPKLRIPVRRDAIVQDALDALVEAQAYGSSSGHRMLKWPLMVSFKGEEGIDEGGVAKEFFQLLVEELFNPDFNMFCRVNDDQNFWFAPNSMEALVQFELIGIVLGLAVYNRVILDVQFPRVLYRKLLSSLSEPKLMTPAEWAANDMNLGRDATSALMSRQSPPTPQTAASPLLSDAARRTSSVPISEFEMASQLSDVQIIADMNTRLAGFRPYIDDLDDVYPHIAIGLRKLLKCPPEEVQSFGLTFSVTVNNFGDSQDIPLPDLAGGKHDPEMKVTSENRVDYVKAVLYYYLVDASRPQFEAFYRGFHRCCGGPAIVRFQPDELNLVICGVPGDLDFDDLQRGSKYADGFTQDSPIIRWFWKVANELSQEDKKKLLFFVTGSDRTPVAGLASLQLTIIRAGGEPNRLPTAHTCFNHLLLPEYTSEEQLRSNLLYAIEYRHGFGLL